MPALGMAQDSGKLIRWLKREGQRVTKGEPLMEVETDKATVEIEAAATGILAHVTAQEGDTVPVAQVIALIVAPGEALPQSSKPSALTAAAGHRQPERPRSGGASPVAMRVAEQHRVDLSQVPAGDGKKISKADVLAYLEAQGGGRAGDGAKLLPASPKARRLAGERGIALETMRGSGPGGAVLAEDVILAEPMDAPAAARSAETLEVSRAWQVMAQRLSAGWPSVPHFYLIREVDATRLVAWRDLAQKKAQDKVTYTDLLVKVVASALKMHPRVNSSWNGSGITRNPDINVGLAVAVEDGLLVPVIHRADSLTVGQIAATRCELVERASAGRMRPDDLQGGTFTISNLGMYGVDAFNAIVNPPEAAILAVGRIADRVVPMGGQPAIRPVMVLSLSCDHRVVDGMRGAQFLDTLAWLIEEPMGLIDQVIH
jgi:pyruvate dehydrogenase E2 component (dihydrolipoamide acetyltransferase)